MLHRLQTFVESVCFATKRYRFFAEIVLVEWNPPADRPRLLSALVIPDSAGYCDIRVIKVCGECHSRILYSDQLPLYQMLGKNVGIRRARGKFVLSTNMDILCSAKLFEYIAAQKLEPGRFYRATRYDIGTTIVPSSEDYDSLLAHCRRNTIRVHDQESTKDITEEERFELWRCVDNRPVQSFESADFQFDTNDSSLFTNASGDFTLMAREDWLAVRGYPELARGDLHVDSLLLENAHSIGLRQAVLPAEMHVFHIEHEGSWVLQSRDTSSLRQRISLDYHAHVLGWSRFLKKYRGQLSNHPAWGQQDIQLEEFVVQAKPGAKVRQTVHNRIAEQSVCTPYRISGIFHDSVELETTKALQRLISFYRPTRFVVVGNELPHRFRAADQIAQRLGFSIEKTVVTKPGEPIDLKIFDDVRVVELSAQVGSLPNLWSSEDRVLLMVSSSETFPGSTTHDFMNRIIPTLPVGSVVAWDSMWFVPQPRSEGLSTATVERMLRNISRWEHGLSFDFAAYWKGGYFAGSRNVIPLVHWANQRKAEILSIPGSTLSAFDILPIDYEVHPPTDKFFLESGRITLGSQGNIQITSLCKLLQDTVVASNSVEAMSFVDSLCDAGLALFHAKDYARSYALFENAALSGLQRPMIQFGRALSLAYTGKQDQALEALKLELSINPSLTLASELQAKLLGQPEENRP